MSDDLTPDPDPGMPGGTPDPSAGGGLADSDATTVMPTADAAHDHDVSPSGALEAGEPREHPAAALGGEPPKDSRALIIAVAVIALIAVVAIVVWVAGKGRPPVEPAPEPTATAPASENAQVPSVVVMSEKEATNALAKAGFTWTTVTGSSKSVPQGSVIAQYPDAGTELAKGSSVALEVSGGQSGMTSLIPNVLGKTQNEAKSILSAAGFAPAIVIADNEAPKDEVYAQSPAGGVPAELGSAVVVQVSSGAKPPAANTTVPKVVGLTQASAESALKGAGLGVQVVQSASATVAAGTVMLQSPAPGSMVAPGTIVAIVISTGPSSSSGDLVAVPNVVGKTMAQATQELSDLGLLVVAVSQPAEGAPAGVVLATLPEAGSRVPAGSKVAVVQPSAP